MLAGGDVGQDVLASRERQLVVIIGHLLQLHLVLALRRLERLEQVAPSINKGLAALGGGQIDTFSGAQAVGEDAAQDILGDEEELAVRFAEQDFALHEHHTGLNKFGVNYVHKYKFIKSTRHTNPFIKATDTHKC